MTPVVAAKKVSRFDPKTFLSTINDGRRIEPFLKKRTIFAQGYLLNKSGESSQSTA